jgi:hypothetical protein
MGLTKPAAERYASARAPAKVVDTTGALDEPKPGPVFSLSDLR